MFPSVFSTFNRPTPSDRLNSPSHSALHNTVSSAVGQIEAVIGSSNTSVLGTIIGDLRNPTSGGGGHIQAVNKGGTGQTTYTKGDILVATSSSVLSKLATGGDQNILTADSTQASGLKWVAGPGSAPTFITTSPYAGTLTAGTVNLNTSVIATIGLFQLPLRMEVNRISLLVAGHTTPGSAKLGIYDITGQTQITSVLYASVTGTGRISANVSSVVLNGGSYYYALTSLEGEFTVRSVLPTADLQIISGTVGQERRYYSSMVAIGGALPNSFNTAFLPLTTPNFLNIRLDN